MNDNQFLTVRNVAEMFHVQPVTVYRLVQRGTLPYLRLGRKLVFDRQAVIASMRHHESRNLSRSTE